MLVWILLLFYILSIVRFPSMLFFSELVRAQIPESVGLLFSMSLFCHTHCLLLLFVLAAYSYLSLFHMVTAQLPFLTLQQKKKLQK